MRKETDDMRLTEIEKTEIRKQRVEGIGYLRIANSMGISVNTIRSFCKRNDLVGRARKKEFCSDECRVKWWNAHQNQVSRKAVYEFTCAYCGKSFTVYGNNHRKYCNHDCYIADRFGKSIK